MAEHAALAAARRARPICTVTVDGEPYRIRPPTMGAVRAFQQQRQVNQVDAIAAFFCECILGEGDQPDLPLEAAKEMAEMPWVSGPLLGGILRVSQGERSVTIDTSAPVEQDPAPPAPAPAPTSASPADGEAAPKG